MPDHTLKTPPKRHPAAEQWASGTGVDLTDAPVVLDLISEMVRGAVQPARARSAEEMRTDIPRFLSLLDEVQADFGLSNEDAYDLLRVYLSKYLETRVGEMLTSTLSHALPRGGSDSFTRWLLTRRD